MAIPINVKDLIDANIIESTRIEYKSNFNPDSIIKTICAFANDIDNTGGGYIVIGVEEDNGRPKKPISGLNYLEIDKVMKKLIEYCHFLEPLYEPVIEPVKYIDETDDKEKNLIFIWVPSGYGRPYMAPKDVINDKRNKEYYIRKFSSTVVASNIEKKELFEVSSFIPFDDRMCLPAEVTDLSLSEIKEFLRKVDSKLLLDYESKSLISIARDLKIVSGSEENEKPLNVGILMFCDNPQKYFPYARIELVEIPDPTGINMIEKVFTGTIQTQLEQALRYIKGNIIKEAVIKYPDIATASRFYNYPFAAIEEILTNAVYHRSYQVHEPITVRIEKDLIEITSHPGFDRTITDEDIKNYIFRARYYRNRRIGDFLKELHYTEGRNTGYPNAINALKENGSDLPKFEMNDQRDFISVIIPIHPYFKSKKTETKTDEYLNSILNVIKDNELTLTEIARAMGYKGISKKLKVSVEALVATGRIENKIIEGSIKYRRRS